MSMKIYSYLIYLYDLGAQQKYLTSQKENQENGLYAIMVNLGNLQYKCNLSPYICGVHGEFAVWMT